MCDKIPIKQQKPLPFITLSERCDSKTSSISINPFDKLICGQKKNLKNEQDGHKNKSL
jgi:hypothetical protein